MTMKKLLAIVIIPLMILSHFGCAASLGVSQAQADKAVWFRDYVNQSKAISRQKTDLVVELGDSFSDEVVEGFIKTVSNEAQLTGQQAAILIRKVSDFKADFAIGIRELVANWQVKENANEKNVEAISRIDKAMSRYLAAGATPEEVEPYVSIVKSYIKEKIGSISTTPK